MGYGSFQAPFPAPAGPNGFGVPAARRKGAASVARRFSSPLAAGISGLLKRFSKPLKRHGTPSAIHPSLAENLG